MIRVTMRMGVHFITTGIVRNLNLLCLSMLGFVKNKLSNDDSIQYLVTPNSGTNPSWLVGFYGISTFVSYLMPNPFLCK